MTLSPGANTKNCDEPPVFLTGFCCCCFQWVCAAGCEMSMLVHRSDDGLFQTRISQFGNKQVESRDQTLCSDNERCDVSYIRMLYGSLNGTQHKYKQTHVVFCLLCVKDDEEFKYWDENNKKVQEDKDKQKVKEGKKTDLFHTHSPSLYLHTFKYLQCLMQS